MLIQKHPLLKITFQMDIQKAESMYAVIFDRMFLNPYSAGIDFSRQNLMSVDVRFCRLKSIPTL